MNIEQLKNTLDTANIPYKEWEDGLLDKFLEKINNGQYSIRSLSDGREILVYVTTIVIILYHHISTTSLMLVKSYEKTASGEILRDGAHDPVSFPHDNDKDPVKEAEEWLKSNDINTICGLSHVENTDNEPVSLPCLNGSWLKGISMFSNQIIFEATITMTSYKPLGRSIPTKEGGYIRYTWEPLLKS